MGLLASIGICVIVAAALAVVAARLKQPLIIAYIATGALLGPHIGINLSHEEESIEQIAEIGLILLLFLIGLELSLPRLLQAGRVITVSGLLKVPICATMAWFVMAPVAAATGGPFDRLYLAIGTGFASTLILVKMLSDKKELTTFAGRAVQGDGSAHGGRSHRLPSLQRGGDPAASPAYATSSSPSSSSRSA